MLSPEVEALLAEYHPMDNALFTADPPAHTRHRALDNKALNPRRIRLLEGKMREVFKEEIEGPAKEVEKILKPEQFTRLKQIGRQQGGPSAYLSPDNAKDLGLTDDQKKKLKDITDELQKDTMALFQGGFSAETREKMQMLNKEATEKAAGVLTDEQKTKWKELTGEPFSVPLGGGRQKRDD